MRYFIPFLIPVLAGMAACASVNEQAGFESVSETVLAKTESAIVWDRDEAVEETVAALLKEPLTPESAVRAALINNPEILAANRDLTVAEARKVRAGLLANPEVHAEFKFVLDGPGEILELGLMQDVLKAALIPQRKAAARAQFEAAQSAVIGAVLDLALDVKKAFYSHRADLAVLDLMESTHLGYEAAYDMAKRLRVAGNITELDLKTREAALELSRLDVERAKTDAAVSRERLNALMGLGMGDIDWEADPEMPSVSDPVSNKDPIHADYEQQAVKNSLELAEARSGIEAASKRVEIAKVTSVIPGLSLGAAAEQETDGAWLVGPAVSFPIPLFDRGGAQRAEARAELQRRKHLYSALENKVRVSVRTAYKRLDTERKRARYYMETVVPLYEEITRQYQLQYNAMQIGVFRLLEAKQREIDIKKLSILALRDYRIAEAEFEQILNGRLIRRNAAYSASGTDSPIPFSGAGNASH